MEAFAAVSSGSRPDKKRLTVPPLRLVPVLGYRGLVAAILGTRCRCRIIDAAKAPDDHVHPEGGACDDTDRQQERGAEVVVAEPSQHLRRAATPEIR